MFSSQVSWEKIEQRTSTKPSKRWVWVNIRDASPRIGTERQIGPPLGVLHMESVIDQNTSQQQKGQGWHYCSSLLTDGSWTSHQDPGRSPGLLGSHWESRDWWGLSQGLSPKQAGGGGRGEGRWGGRAGRKKRQTPAHQHPKLRTEHVLVSLHSKTHEISPPHGNVFIYGLNCVTVTLEANLKSHPVLSILTKEFLCSHPSPCHSQLHWATRCQAQVRR